MENKPYHIYTLLAAYCSFFTTSSKEYSIIISRVRPHWDKLYQKHPEDRLERYFYDGVKMISNPTNYRYYEPHINGRDNLEQSRERLNECYKSLATMPKEWIIAYKRLQAYIDKLEKEIERYTKSRFKF